MDKTILLANIRHNAPVTARPVVASLSPIYLTASGNGAFKLEKRLQTKKQALRKQGQDARRDANGVIAVFEAHVIAAFVTVA